MLLSQKSMPILYLCKKICLGLMFSALALPLKSQETTPGVMHYYNDKGQVKTVKNKNDWSVKKNQVLQAMQQVMGALPKEQLQIPDAVFLDTLETTGYTRYTIRLKTYYNEIVPALLYLPKNKTKQEKYPAVLALHSTGQKGKHLVDSFSANPYKALATELVQRGYIVLAPDYPGFGDLSDHDFDKDRFESGTMQGIFNHMRCIDYLQSRNDVIHDKIGVIGHSLGGHNAIFLGAFDERLKIVVSSCGWTMMTHYDAGKPVTERFGGKLGPWAQDRYMPLIRDKYNLNAAQLPVDFDEIIATIAPRYFLSNSPTGDENFNVDGVKLGIANAYPIYKLLGVADRLQAYYPEAGHDFPDAVRKAIYEEMDAVLK